MSFEATYSGAVMQLRNGVEYSIRADGAFAAAYVSQDRMTQVVLTGYTAISPRGNKHYETTAGTWIYLPDGWEQVGVRAVNKYSDRAANALIRKIIANNDIIIRNNLLCARYANKLSESEQSQVRNLQSRLQARNNALQVGSLTTDVQIAPPTGYAELSVYLDKFMAGEQVGIAVSTIAWIVIAAVVIAGMGTAAYYLYKNMADESEQDVKYSKELTAILAQKLTPEEYEQLKNETKGIVTKAKIRQALGSYGNVIKLAAFAVAGVAIYKLIQNYVSRG